MRTIENDCVGCPQGCVPWCNRKGNYKAIWCDICGEWIEPDDVYVDGNGSDICPDCLRKMEEDEDGQ